MPKLKATTRVSSLKRASYLEWVEPTTVKVKSHGRKKPFGKRESSLKRAPSIFRRPRSKEYTTNITKNIDNDGKKRKQDNEGKPSTDEKPSQISRRTSMSKVARQFFLSRGVSTRAFFERSSDKSLRDLKKEEQLDIDTSRSSDTHGDITVSSSKENDENCQRLLEKAKQLDQAGNDFFQQGKYQDSLKSYTEAMNIKKHILRLTDDDVDMDDQDESKGMKSDLLASVATSINNIGFLRQRLGSGTNTEIMSVYKESLKLKKKILGNDHLSVGTTLNNIGSVYFSNESFEEALKAYQQALDILVLNLGGFHMDVATVYSNIGDVYFATKKMEEAGISYDMALKIRWSELGVDGKRDQRIIRLLERISTIEMAKMTLELEGNARQTLDRRDSSEMWSEEDSFKQLGQDAKKSVEQIEKVERKLELEMFRDKLQVACDMRDISTYEFSSDEEKE